MKTLLTFSIAALFAATNAMAETESEKQTHRHPSRDRIVRLARLHGYRPYRVYRGPRRTIYVIERNRPVARTVYLADDGRYYRWIDGRRRYIVGRYYTTYPSRYYYRDGRPRLSVHVRF